MILQEFEGPGQLPQGSLEEAFGKAAAENMAYLRPIENQDVHENQPAVGPSYPSCVPATQYSQLICFLCSSRFMSSAKLKQSFDWMFSHTKKRTAHNKKNLHVCQGGRPEDAESIASTVTSLGSAWEPDKFKYIREIDGTVLKVPRPNTTSGDNGSSEPSTEVVAVVPKDKPTEVVAVVPQDKPTSSTESPAQTPQPGMIRRRTKRPEIVRPMVSTPLEPPSEPEKVVAAAEQPIVNPLEQLKMVVLWFENSTKFLPMIS